MTGEPVDADLRRQFLALRELDMAAAPEFDAVWARALQGGRARASVSPWRGRSAAAAIAASAATVWLTLASPPAPPDLATVTLPGWRTPTDSLMVVAGDPLPPALRTGFPTDGLGRPSFNLTPEIR